MKHSAVSGHKPDFFDNYQQIPGRVDRTLHEIDLMKRNLLVYWVTTAIIAAAMLYSSYSYFFDPAMESSFVNLGFPDYFRVQLGFAKAAGAFCLLIPRIPARIKEFAYAGFAIAYVSAFIAHTAVNDPVSEQIKAVLLLLILAVSWIYFYKLRPAGILRMGS